MSELLYIFLTTQHKGGTLMWPIFGVAVIAWFIGINKFIKLNRFSRERKQFLQAVQNIVNGKQDNLQTGNAEYDLLLQDMQQSFLTKKCACRFAVRFREFLICTIPDLGKGLSTMSAWIGIAPLLGLLGTVDGMIFTFKIITSFGVGNPSLTAEGISIALLTTQAGLTVAFPSVLLHNFLANMKNSIVSKLIKDGEDLLNKFKPLSAE